MMLSMLTKHTVETKCKRITAMPKRETIVTK